MSETLGYHPSHQAVLERYAEAHQDDGYIPPLPADQEYHVGTDRIITGAQVNEQLFNVDLEAGMTEYDRAELAYQLTDDYIEDKFEAAMEAGWAESMSEELGMSVDDVYAQPDSYVFNVEMARDMAQEESSRREDAWAYGDDAATWSASYDAAQVELDAYDDLMQTSTVDDQAEL